MREIKFRAWDGLRLGSPKMIYSLQLKVEDLRDLDKWKVMQYTGLKDKNGKEIYEGDIVTWPHLNDDISYEIYYNSEEVHYFGRPLNNLDTTESYLDSTHMKLIGNIYENPELLKK